MGRVRIIGGDVALYDRGRVIYLQKYDVLVHDPSGRSLDKSALFIGPARLRDDPVSRRTKFDESWFGGDYELRIALIDVPDEGWHPIGQVDEILYFRPGQHEGDWKHRFKEPQPLYQSGRWRMIVLPSDSRITGRGIEYP